MSIAERPGDRDDLRRSGGTWRQSGSTAFLLDLIRTARAALVRSLASGDAGATDSVGPLDDAAGVAGAAPGDLVAAAYERYQREIHSFALHSTRDPEIAADVTQEAFLKLLRETSAGRTPDNIRAWLYRVATNLIINRAKHLTVADRVRRAWRPDDETMESPETTAIRAEQHERLRDVLAELSHDARSGLLLAAHGFSGREVAEALGRTELATRSLLCRARLQLRAALTEVGEET